MEKFDKAISAKLDKYGYLKFFEEKFTEKYTREGERLLDIRDKNLLCNMGYPVMSGGEEPTIIRKGGKLICEDYPQSIFEKYPVLTEIYEALEKMK